MRRPSGLDDLLRDIRFAARALGRTPMFTATVVASLALGLALAASTIAVVNAYLIRSLPYPLASRLYHVRYAPPGPVEPRGVSAVDWRSLADVVDIPVTASGQPMYLTADGGFVQPARGLRVTPGFLEALGVRAAVGRTFVRQEFEQGADVVALIGQALWRERFGGDSGVVGRRFEAQLEEQEETVRSYRIIGVLPERFWFGRDSRDQVDILLPLRAPAQTYMVRLRSGVDVTYAERRITQATRQVATWIPQNWTGVHLQAAHERYVERIRPVLVGVTLSVGLLLVIVCANVAVLTLLRAMRRQDEIGVRVALGAGRWHLARMLGAEAGLVCSAALAAGLLLAGLTVGLIAPNVESQLGRPAPGGTASIAIDSTVVLIAGGVAAVVALSLAFVPALAPWQRRLASTLRRAGRGGTDGLSMRRLRASLIALEVAGSLALLVGCGLMIRSVVGMLRGDLGFSTARIVRASIVFPGRAYPDHAARSQFYRRLVERVGTLSDSPVALTSWPPYFETPRETLELPGGDSRGRVGVVSVGPGYFATLNVPVRRGRAFTDADGPGAEPVAVVSEALARRLWPDGGAIGRSIRAVPDAMPGSAPAAWRTVVGVVGDVRQTHGDEELDDVYLPFLQTTFERFVTFYFRSDRPVPELLANLRTVLAEADPRVVVRGLQRMSDEDRQLAGTTFLTSLSAGFAGFAVILALLGLYGVTAYSVQQRRREIAIRVALGATAQGIAALFLRDTGRVLGIGLVCGVAGAVAVVKLLQNRVTGVGAFDLTTLVIAGGVMAAAGLLATWLPARGAAGRSPITSLNEG
jgi:putative ABC transport system permease protein